MAYRSLEEIAEMVAADIFHFGGVPKIKKIVDYAIKCHTERVNILVD